ncbi:8196_t:CDS:2, partial [Racocetra persica]
QDAEVAKVVHQVKQQARVTKDKPAKIIQDAVISTPEKIGSYLPSINAWRKKIHCVRNTGLPPQPQNITEFSIPQSLQITLNGIFEKSYNLHYRKTSTQNPLVL